MNNKQIWIGIFISGITLGAVIVWTFLFLNARLERRSQPTLEESWEYVSEREIAKEAETQMILNELLGGQEDAFLDITKIDRDLCSVVTRDDMNRLLPEINIVSVQRSQVPPFSDCDYFKDSITVPAVSFRHNFANLQLIKDLQKAQGIEARVVDFTGIGDEAFFSEISTIPGTARSFRTIFFRVGENGYSVGSFELTESQLKVVAGAAVKKLIE